MAHHRVDQSLVHVHLMEQLVGLDAVLLRPELKVDVVHHAHRAPEVHPLRVKLPGQHPHDLGYGPSVLQMERLLVVFTDDIKGFFRRGDPAHD